MLLYISFTIFLIYEGNFIIKDKSNDNVEKIDGNQTDFEDIIEALKDNISILCLIHTSPKYKDSRAIHLKNTWLRRCNDYLFISTEDDESLPAIKCFKKDGYQYSNGRMRKGLSYVYETYNNKYDWILKADDDTYAIMENIRMFLINRDPTKNHYYGFKLKIKDYYGRRINYMSGGGYIISKGALKNLVTIAFKNYRICSPTPNIPDDIQIGRCLNNINISAMDSRDIHNRHIFLPSSFSEFSSIIKNIHWDGFKKRSYYELTKGYTALGDFPMTFHYAIGDMQYGLEYLLYNVDVVGRQSKVLYDSGNSMTIETAINKIKNFSKTNFKYEEV
uniref:N-acetylgalactosaminide beta-1,3-galactosyltransferase n=1 Tax=Parastrongyloides trichosuri TaxID=131310 RepID=A0A0N4Z490_PARTI